MKHQYSRCYFRLSRVQGVFKKSFTVVSPYTKTHGDDIPALLEVLQRLWMRYGCEQLTFAEGK